MSKLIKYFLLLLTIIILISVVLLILYRFFGGDWRVSLPRGYSLVRTYASAVLMSDSNHIVVINPCIDEYKVYEDKNLIVGHVTRTPGLLPVDSADSRPGFFIVDTRSGVTMEGLEEKAWLDSLRIYGISEKPRLHEP